MFRKRPAFVADLDAEVCYGAVSLSPLQASALARLTCHSLGLYIPSPAILPLEKVWPRVLFNFGDGSYGGVYHLMRR